MIFGKGMEDMIASMIGINPEELKAQITKAMGDATTVINGIQHQQNVTLEGVQICYHKITRIEKMMESIARKIGADISELEPEQVNGPGSNVVAIGNNTKQ